MTKTEKEPDSNNEEMSFEEALEELEKIVRRLEEDEVPLEESVKLYEEGMKLSKFCSETLEEAEQRIVKVNKKLDEEGLSSTNEKNE